jgi:hypothetical protein
MPRTQVMVSWTPADADVAPLAIDVVCPGRHVFPPGLVVLEAMNLHKSWTKGPMRQRRRLLVRPARNEPHIDDQRALPFATFPEAGRYAVGTTAAVGSQKNPMAHCAILAA